MPTSIYACGACNQELFNNLEIVIHDKENKKAKFKKQRNLQEELRSHCSSSVSARHRSMPAFAFDQSKAKLSSSRRFLSKDNLSHLDSDQGSECDIEAATVVSAGGAADMPKRDFLSFKAF